MKRHSFWAAANKAVLVTITIAVFLVFVPAGWADLQYKTLYQFTGGVDGNDPWSALVFDSAGNLYGTTRYGGAYAAGNAFKLAPNGDGTWTETVIQSFGQGGYEGQIVSPLVLDSAGNLYGMSNGGGTAPPNVGTIFELIPSPDGSWTETTLYTFAGGTDGSLPVGGLALDTGGNLYGMTSTGGGGNCTYPAGLGTSGCGTVFKLTHNQDGTWTESVIHAFTGGPDGGYPDQGGPILDVAGSLYGVTRNGGLAGPCDWGDCGVVFRLSPNPDGSWTETVLHAFTGTDGGNPESKSTLIFDSSGDLYGTTLNGGAYGAGVVFKLIPGSGDIWTLTVLHEFTGGGDGGYTYSGLILDGAGNLYGTALTGGTSDCGVVYELMPNADGSWADHVLYAFDDNPGCNPGPSLILDGADNLYGMTNGGGGGTVYELMSPLPSTMTVLSIAATPSSSQSYQGSPVTFTATVTHSTGTAVPTGRATFASGVTVLGTGTLSGSIATYTTSSLAVGTYSVVATYSGDANYAGSSSSASSLAVIALPTVSLSPSSISFPSQYVGTFGLPQTVTLTNTGSATLTISATNITAADFAGLSACGNSVAPGSSCSIGIFFDPAASGTRSGALTITDNALGSPQDVQLTGIGQDFTLALGSQKTATVTSGQSASYLVSIAPGGGFNQTVALSCSGAPAQSTCTVSPNSVALTGTSASMVTVTVATARSSLAGVTQQTSGPRTDQRAALWLALFGTLGLTIFLNLTGWLRGRRAPRLYELAFLLLVAIGSSMFACGGGGGGGSRVAGAGGTPAGTYSLTVTGTFTAGPANLTRTTKLTLVVQ